MSVRMGMLLFKGMLALALAIGAGTGFAGEQLVSAIRSPQRTEPEAALNYEWTELVP